jgi:hypothetical protein
LQVRQSSDQKQRAELVLCDIGSHLLKTRPFAVLSRGIIVLFPHDRSPCKQANSLKL